MSNKQNDILIDAMKDSLNEYQLNNIKIINGISDRNDWSRLPSGILSCVACGQHKITAPILNFFNFDGDRLMCYDCQNTNTKPFDEKKFWQDKQRLATNYN